MKKTVAVMLVLAAAALVCFFAGWAQFAVPPGSVGVIRSKSHGLDTRVVEGGAFRWVWYKLIPGNVTVSAFKPSAQALTVEAAGTLPQAEAYIAFTGIKGDFSYNVELRAEYVIKPECLPQFVSERDIYTQEEMDAQLEALNAKIRLFVLSGTGDMARSGISLKKTEGGESGEEILRAALRDEFPYLDWKETVFYEHAAPDFELYSAAQETYALYIERQRDILRGEALRRAGERSAEDFKREELEKYGELITRYPFILEFLRITKEGAGPEEAR